MSDEKDDDQSSTRFGGLEKKIVTDSINPGGKPDYLTQRNKRKRMRGLDDPHVVRSDESVPAVVPASVLRGSVLGVVYLVVLAGFVWTGWNAVNAYMGTHGSGSEGRAVVSKCAPIDWKQPGSWFYPVATCSGYFVPTSPAELNKGVAVSDNVSVVGAGDAKAGQEISDTHMPSTGTTVYVSGWSGWIWWSVVAVALLLVFLFLTFRRHGVVPGIRAVLSARAAKRARVNAQEQARERARELRKKRAAEAREKAATKSGKSESGEKSSESAPAAKKAEPVKKPSGPTTKKAEPAKAAKPKKKAKNPAHVGTVAGTARKVEAEDAEEDVEEDAGKAD